jgi:hypothetical protein
MVSAHPVLEAVLLELKRPRILADDPSPCPPGSHPPWCRDLHGDLDLDALSTGQVQEDLLGEAGQIPAVALGIDAVDAEDRTL